MLNPNVLLIDIDVKMLTETDKVMCCSSKKDAKKKPEWDTIGLYDDLTTLHIT